MSKSSDAATPDLWTHEPHIHLEFKPGQSVAALKTNATPGFKGSKRDAPDLQDERNGRFAELQEMLYASSRAGDNRKILLVLQGMDTAGKGGIVKHVVGSGNPQGIKYASFGKPTEEELAHDFLWRIEKQSADSGAHRGVRPVALRGRPHRPGARPGATGRVGQALWPHQRLREGLVDDGTTIIKVAMFVSLDEQKKRLSERLDRPDKYWKYNPADIDERLLWPRYQEAYQAMLERTSTDFAPWHVIPCDRKWYSRLAITELLIEALEGFDVVLAPSRFRCRGREEAAEAGLAHPFSPT